MLSALFKWSVQNIVKTTFLLCKNYVRELIKQNCFDFILSDLIKQNCEFRYFYNITIIPSILDGGSKIVLANMLSEKRLICSYDQGLAKPLPTSPYVLDGGSKIVLANMLSGKRLICLYDQGLAKPLPTSPYVLADRQIFCHCHIQSGLTYVLKNIASCNATDRPQLQYSANLAFLTYFSSFLNNTEDSDPPLSTERVLPITMEDYSEDP